MNLMEEDTAIIVASGIVLFLFSPTILFFTIAVLDTLGIDRALPEMLFYLIAPAIPTVISCGILAGIMKFLKKPTSWIKIALSRITLAAYFMFYMLMSFMQAK